MKLYQEQLERFDREGYLFFPGQFTREEMKELVDEVPELYSRREAYNVREKGKEAVRTNFAAHLCTASPSASWRAIHGWSTPSRLHTDRMSAEQLPAEGLSGRSAVERRHRGRRVADDQRAIRRNEAGGVNAAPPTHRQQP